VGSSSSAVIANCIFANNTSNRGGGAIVSYGNVTAKNTQFLNNTAFAGGAWRAEGTNSCHNCTFTGNRAATEHGGAFSYVATGDGGWSSIVLMNSVFINNSAAQDGGAVHGVNGATIINSKFTSNVAGRVGGAVAQGAVDTANWLNYGDQSSIAWCTFDSNGATAGGALSCNSTAVNVTSSVFKSNTAVTVAGAAQLLYAVLENCSFTDNSARSGGAIDMAESTEFDARLPNVSCAECHFSSNRATTGAAVRISGTCNVTDSTFTNGTATLSGGAVHVSYNGQTNILRSSFSSNSATFGGIVYTELSSYATIVNSNGTSNTALEGGAINSLGNTTLAGATLMYNTADAGAAVYITSSEMLISGSILSYNNATTGGAVSVSDNATLTITASTISDNTAIEAGGGVFQITSTTGSSGFRPLLDAATVIRNNRANCCNAASALQNNCSNFDTGGDTTQCCRSDEYSNGTHCHACADVYNCQQLGITEATLVLKPHFWRENLTVARSRECWNSDACIGGVAVKSTNEYCAAGYKGPCKLSLYLVYSMCSAASNTCVK
jgi:predicted outer membrane repeat protein